MSVYSHRDVYVCSCASGCLFHELCSHNMLIPFSFQKWEQDPETFLIIIKGAGGKAFCAGGDIVGKNCFPLTQMSPPPLEQIKY